MNIVIFTDTFLPKIDGVAVSTEHFTRILAARGHNFIICCPKYGKNDTTSLGENIELIRFKSGYLPSYPDIKVVLPSRKKIKKAMTSFKPDLVHLQTPGLLGQYGVLAARMYGVPLVGTYHTLVSEQDTYVSLYRLLKLDALLNRFKRKKKLKKKKLGKVERKSGKSLKKRLILKLCNNMYEKGRAIISPSHMIKKELESQGVRTPVHVISNGMDLSRFKSDVKSAPGDSPRFLHVGRISHEKNCEVVLKAFSLILEKKPGATLDIIGDGPALTSLKIEAKQLGIADKVSFPGFINRAELPEVYPKYDMFLTASTMETQGLVVLEAISCGLPCVGVDAYALPELIHDGENGYVVESFDHKTMAEKALELLENPTRYKEFSARGLEIARGHELEACADKLEEFYLKYGGSGDSSADKNDAADVQSPASKPDLSDVVSS